MKCRMIDRSIYSFLKQYFTLLTKLNHLMSGRKKVNFWDFYWIVCLLLNNRGFNIWFYNFCRSRFLCFRITRAILVRLFSIWNSKVSLSSCTNQVNIIVHLKRSNRIHWIRMYLFINYCLFGRSVNTDNFARLFKKNTNIICMRLIKK